MSGAGEISKLLRWIVALSGINWGINYRMKILSLASLTVFSSVGLLTVSLFSGPIAAAERPKPNVILIVADDLGYGDLSCYGGNFVQTPHLDELAARGVRCTAFKAASSVCSASRAGLLTSRYPPRTGVIGVVSANRRDHLPLDELTLAERFQQEGYRTAIFGKWHLGNHAAVWPLNQGFDEWEGTVGSNDMGKGRPSLEARRAGKAGVEWVKQDQVIEIDPDQTTLTNRTTALATQFIRKQQGGPFFLYLPFNMPHTPLFVSDEWKGKSFGGLYGDVIGELDSAVGRIVSELKRTGLEERTIIAFTSDNGPWLIFGDHGGSNGGLSGGKKQTLEGGLRVPFIIAGPGVAGGQTDNDFVSGLDVGPTLFSLAGLPWDESKQIDGRSRSDRWAGTGELEEETQPYFCFYDRELRAIQHGRWKWQLPHLDKQTPDPASIGYGGDRGKTMKVDRGSALYDLLHDPGEQVDRSGAFPEILTELRQFAKEGKAIANTREPDFLEHP